MKKILLVIGLSAQGLIAAAQTFFTEDFAAGIPAGWTNVDNSGNNILWRTTTTGSTNSNVSVDTVLNTAGTTAANGYLIIDSDSAGQTVTQDAVLTSTAINCTGHASVHLAFNQYFAQYLASTGTVSVSNDNTNWTDVHLAHDGLGLNQGTPNAEHVLADITSVAANQATVYVRFSYHGEWDYWWFVDDLALIEPPAVDLAVTSIEKLNNEYTLIPFVQATALTLSAEVTNVGGGTATGGTALFEVFNGVSQVFSENINLPSIAPGTSTTVIPSATFAPASAGSYKSKLTVTIAGDGNASNDLMESVSILLSDTVYARDDGAFAGTMGIGVGAGQDATMGQNFRINTSDNLTSVSFFLDEGFGAQAAGTPVYVTIHTQPNDTTNPDAIPVAVSETLLVTPGMIPSGGFYYTLAIQGGPIALNPGLYFLGIHEVDSILTIGYSNSIYTPRAVWVHWNSIPSPPAVNGWTAAENFTVEIAYMLRANLASNWDQVAEITGSPELSVYPNPSSGKIYLSLNNFTSASPIHVTISNLLGQEEFTGTWDGRQVYSCGLDNMPAGIYHLNIRFQDISITKKIVIAD